MVRHEIRPCYGPSYYAPQKKHVPHCTWDYEDDDGKVEEGPTIEYRTDICETQCMYDEALKPDDVEPAAVRIMQLQTQIEGGRPYDADDLPPEVWELIGFVKQCREDHRLNSIAMMMVLR